MTPVTPSALPARTGRLLRKYALFLTGAVLLALVSSAAIQYQFLVRDFTGFSVRLQREQAQAAADKIDDFIKDIERQIAWTTQLPWSAATMDEWRLDAARLLQLTPAITEYRRLDSRGIEQLRVSRIAPDRIGGGGDFSQDPAFTTAMKAGVYHGPVDFRRGSEPYMTIALRGAGQDVGVVEINLKFIWDVVSRIKVGARGRAYVVSDAGRLIAHPNLNLVLRNTDVSQLSQVRNARADGTTAPEDARAVADLEGREVLAASARIPTLDWLLLTELPAEEAFTPLDAALRRTALIIIGALALAVLAAFLLARALVGPIEALRIGAMRIGAGDFEHRIAIKTNDEVQSLADQFNLMAGRLQESHDTLRQRVRQRTAELTAANRRLAAAGERLRRVNAFKSEILGIVAHDLRNPLSVIMTRAELLAKVGAELSPSRDAIATHAAAIEHAGGRLVGMIEALLVDAMAEAHEITIRRLSVDLAALVDEVIKANRPFAERKEQTLTVAMPASVTLTGDHDRLREAIDNLVSNAIKYTQQGGDIGVEVTASADHALIAVADNGAGLTESDMPRLFGRFQRLSARPTAGEASTGLGLSIVKRIVELHGGMVDAHSAGAGQGATFTIALPLPSGGSEQVRQAGSEKDTASATNLVDGAILVVDDNKDVRDSLGVLFESEGMRTVSAASTEEALAAISGGLRPALIVSDYNLHGPLDGIEGIAALRAALGWTVPAVLVTGDSHRPAVEMMTKHGLTAVAKPWKGDELIRLVRELQKGDNRPEVTPAP